MDLQKLNFNVNSLVQIECAFMCCVNGPLQAIDLGVQIQRCHQLVDAHPAFSLTPQEQVALLHKQKQLLRDKT